MYRIKILTEGRCKEKWLGEALKEYEKRLEGRLSIEWVLTDALEAACLKETFFIALDLQGESPSSEAFSQKLEKLWTARGPRLTFVIGGAIGLSSAILQRAGWLWSLSPLTFTHQMVRLLLVEQIYRALEIQKGSKYHK